MPTLRLYTSLVDNFKPEKKKHLAFIVALQKGIGEPDTRAHHYIRISPSFLDVSRCSKVSTLSGPDCPPAFYRSLYRSIDPSSFRHYYLHLFLPVVPCRAHPCPLYLLNTYHFWPFTYLHHYFLALSAYLPLNARICTHTSVSQTLHL